MKNYILITFKILKFLILDLLAVTKRVVPPTPSHKSIAYIRFIRQQILFLPYVRDVFLLYFHAMALSLLLLRIPQEYINHSSPQHFPSGQKRREVPRFHVRRHFDLAYAAFLKYSPGPLLIFLSPV